MLPVTVIASADKVSVTIAIADSSFKLTTAEADALMRRLIEARPLLLPGVQMDDVPPATPATFWLAPNCVDPNYEAGGAFLSLQHPALGWVTWRGLPDACRDLARRLLDWTVPGVPPPKV